jgi:GTPase
VSQYPRPYVAIVGRPNVGKSTLINRVLGGRYAIVHDEPGVTRDRAYYIAEWQHFPFTLVDTGGIFGTSEDAQTTFGRFIREQMQLAVEEADYVIFITDGQTGVTTEDVAIATMLRRLNKPIQVAVNKLDSPKARGQAAEFYELALACDPKPMSALHGDATVGDLLDWVKQDWSARAGSSESSSKTFSSLPPLPSQPQAEEALLDDLDAVLDVPAEPDWEALDALEEGQEFLDTDDGDDSVPDVEPIRVSFVGRPNVGKSSIVNALLGQERGIVSDVAGTTRDSIDTLFDHDGRPYLLVDTAGIRRRAKVDYGVEMFSVDRALQSMGRSDVVALVIDAADGITHHDKRLAEKIRERGKAMILVVNKWDAIVDKDTNATKKYLEKKILPELPHVNFVPVLFISAKTGQRVTRIFSAVDEVYRNAHRRVQTSVLNQVLTEAYALSPPKATRNKLLKLYYGTQVGVGPPTFVIFVNHADAMTANYLRYIERRLRENIEFTGTPLVIHWRARQKKDRILK